MGAIRRVTWPLVACAPDDPNQRCEAQCRTRIGAFAVAPSRMRIVDQAQAYGRAAGAAELRCGSLVVTFVDYQDTRAADAHLERAHDLLDVLQLLQRVPRHAPAKCIAALVTTVKDMLPKGIEIGNCICRASGRLVRADICLLRLVPRLPPGDA